MKFKLWSEYRVFILWYFVSFVFGIALYFGLSFEPYWPIVLGLALFCLGLTFFIRFVWIRYSFFVLLGLFVASFRTSFVDTPFLWRSLWHQEICADVVDVYSKYSGQTLFLENISLKQKGFVPRQARVSFNEQEPVFHKGDKVCFEGHLFAVQAHQARRFFYQGIGAGGKIKKVISHQQASVAKMDALRLNIMEKLRASLSDKQAEIAIPLVVGEQQIVSPEIYDIYRLAGIAHVLSVSGFHMALLATFVFFLVQSLLALMPVISLRFSAKKVAAVLSLIVTGFYLMISGFQVPAIRSFLMIALVFLGVLTERKTVSLYSVLLVAVVLLCIRPEWITSISFQFSFISVLILVGLYEDVSASFSSRSFGVILLTALLANVIVSVALAPFVIYHFNQFNPYAVMGNLVTSVVFSFCVMPLLFVSTLLMPFGWEGFLLKIVGFLLDKITAVAEWISRLPYAEVFVPSFSMWGLGFVAFGIVWLCLVKSKRRFWGCAVILAGFIIGYSLVRVPDLVVMDKGRAVLVRQEDGSFQILGNNQNWMAKIRLRKNGQDKARIVSDDFVQIRQKMVAFHPDFCQKADLAILWKKSKLCVNAVQFIPKSQKVYDVYLTPDILIQEVGADERKRPWMQEIFYQKEDL